MQARPDSRLDGVLLAEAVRLLEESGGTLDGAATAAASACAAGGDFEARIIRRARALPAAPPLRMALARLRSANALAIAGGGVLALAGGGAAAHALLAATVGARVNVFLSLATLLGLPTLTLLAWLFLVATGAGRMGIGILGRGVFAMTGRLARWFDAGTAQLTMVRAAAQVLAGNAAGRWLAGAISHILWLAYLVGVLAVLLLHFSTREYTFNWETTILAERHYVAATRALAALPEWFGFPVPDATMVVASSKPVDTAAATASRRAWAGLLLGCIVVYGILPRAAALVFAALAARRASRRLRLDTGSPGFARLRPLLMPVARQVGVVDVDRSGNAEVAIRTADAPPLGFNGPVAVFGLEIDEPASGWPPAVRGIDWQDLGFVNDRTDRHRVLDRLAAALPTLRAVLIACALPVTPDRGHLAFVRDLQRQTGLAVLMLLTGGQRLRARGHPQGLVARIDDWHRLALAAGVPAERVIEVDLDHLTDESAKRLAQWLGPVDGGPAAGPMPPTSIDPAFEMIADHARRWHGAPGERERLALQQAIASLYRGTASRWPDLLRSGLPEGVADAASLTSAAERVIALLPGRLRLSPRWLAAGAVAGALGCLAAATLAAPAAIAALPAWAGLGAVVAAVLQRAGGGQPVATDSRDIGEPVAAAALFALILHLQGRDEATITGLLDRALGDADPPRLADAAAARTWLGTVSTRLDSALRSMEVQP